MDRLKRNFFTRDTLTVANELLGKKLVRKFNGKLLTGMIVETEAYLGTSDTACHAHKGKTLRNSVMFGKPGIVYIYFVYGMHYMLNIVTETEGNPCAVLLRAIVPLEGKQQMQKLRGRGGKDMTNGPAKLCQAMAVDKTLNGLDLTLGEILWIENYKTISEQFVSAGPRIGIDFAELNDRLAPLRIWIKNEFLLNPQA